jgi:2-amino-4-hydroxy-6-hydroxymethyldihydropteridine diphosphokinase
MLTATYLGLGSNLGDRVRHLAAAVRAIGELGVVTGVSGVYETDPVGFTDQPAFLNLVVGLDTALEPEALLERIRDIERSEGRRRTFRNAPRTLDIDILLYGERALDRPGLTIPHPRMADRAFVLVPLLELAPGLAEPGTGRVYREHLEALHGAEDPAADALPGIRRIMEGEELLHADDE